MLLTAVVALASCSDGPSSAGGASATPTPSQSGFVNGGECPRASVGWLPEDAGCVTSASSEDRVLAVYALLGDSSRPKSWHIHLRTPEQEIDQPLRAGNDFSYPRVLGASDVDLDGEPDWWIKVTDFTGHGAPWSSTNLFFIAGDRLAPVKFEGRPLAINYGGITRMGEGARCREGRLILLRAEAQNPTNTTWTTSQRVFRLRGRHAVMDQSKEGSLLLEDYNDPALDPYYRIDCEGFVYPS